MRTDRLKATALVLELALIANAACSPQGTAPVEATPPPSDPEKTQSAQPPTDTLVPPTVDTKPTSTPIPANTKTPEPTPTREVSYRCPELVNENTINIMTQISLLNDLKSGKLAEWALKHPMAQSQISVDRSKLDYLQKIVPSAKVWVLGAEKTDKPGWSTKFSRYIGTCRINPAELGIPGKEDMALTISVMEDSLGNKMPYFAIDTFERIKETAANGSLTDPNNQIQPNDIIPLAWDSHFRESGAESGGPNDFTEVAKQLYTAQGKTLDDVHSAYISIADTDIFMADVQIMFKSTIFIGAPGATTYDN